MSMIGTGLKKHALVGDHLACSFAQPFFAIALSLISLLGNQREMQLVGPTKRKKGVQSSTKRHTEITKHRVHPANSSAKQDMEGHGENSGTDLMFAEFYDQNPRIVFVVTGDPVRSRAYREHTLLHVLREEVVRRDIKRDVVLAPDGESELHRAVIAVLGTHGTFSIVLEVIHFRAQERDHTHTVSDELVGEDRRIVLKLFIFAGEPG